MTLVRRCLTLVILALSMLSGVAAADRRYFVHSYTPFLEPAGELELETWSIALAGRGDSTNTAWGNRVEVEYAITDRLTGAFYLNFVQGGGESSAQRFDGPSLELIYLLGERGRVPLDPAVYLEVRENGDELEVEPKLLLARRYGRTVTAANLVGEFEQHHSGDEKGETVKSLQVTAGVSRELGAAVALGVEAFYQRQADGDLGDPSTIFAGPTVNFQAAKIQMALGWHPQLWGRPRTSGGLDLREFARSEFRLILGVDL